MTWPATLRVEAFRTRSPVTIQSDVLVKGAARVMQSRKLRHLPVTNRGGRLVGIVTDRDLRHLIFDPAFRARHGRAADALNSLAVREIMTYGVVTVRTETAIRDTARLMREQRIGAVPVVRSGRLVGILTERDDARLRSAEHRRADTALSLGARVSVRHAGLDGEGRDEGGSAMRVGDVMTRDVEMVDVSTSCHEAATRTLRAKVRHLPVVEANGMLAGIVTDRDLRHGLGTSATSCRSRW
jgi:acetoin utilization protein AcuB